VASRRDTPASRRPSPAWAIAAGLVAGLALGAVTQVMQGLLPEQLGWLANSLSAWLVAAFVLGAVVPAARVAAVASAVMLLAALTGYYLAIQVRYGSGVEGALSPFWLLGAVVGGPVFGSVGWWWRKGSPKQQHWSAGLLGALLVAEGVYFLLVVTDPVVGLGAIAVGILVPGLLGRTWRARLLGYLAVVPCLGLAAAGYVAMLTMYALLTR
jgi:hypothetical protein